MSFIVYKSSAGSGKTFTLVKEYLRLVMAAPEKFRHILAITFTHKAANEMRERILFMLGELSAAQGPESEGGKIMQQYLVESTGLKPEEIKDRSKSVLKLILHNYSDFAISTIDSFVHRIIKSFAFDMHLPVNFEVELDEDNYISQAIDSLMFRVGKEELLTRILVKFSEIRTEEEENWNIERSIREFALQLLKEDVYPYLNELKSMDPEALLMTDKQLRKEIFGFEETLAGIGRKALELMESRGLCQKDFYQGEKGIMKYFQYLMEKRMDKLEPNSLVIKTLDRDDWSSGSAEVGGKQQIQQIKSDLADLFVQVQALRERKEKSYHLFNLLRANIYPVAVLNEISREFDRMRQEDQIIHISEFNKRIANVVMKEPVPFIYERVGEKYTHYLIDEFQDTSLLQWSNLIPLLENSLARKKFNMVVGDAKQSIYRWRSGDVDQFIALPEINNMLWDGSDRGTGSLFAGLGEIRNLEINYRSAEEIVHFNNDFFYSLKDHLPEKTKKVYEDVIQQSTVNKKGGYVEFFRFDQKLDKENYEKETVDRISKVLEGLLEDGYDYSDIAVICRTRKSGSQIALHLIDEGYNVVSDESLMLNSSPKVLFVNAFLRCMENSSDRTNLAIVAEYFIQEGYLKNRNLHDLIDRDKDDEQQISLSGLLGETGLKINLFLLQTLPLYDMIEFIIRELKLDRSFDPYLQFYLDHALKAGTGKSAGLKEWLDWWEKNNKSLSVKMPEGMNAIRVLTIHKSKGLQFPVVIFPFADLDIGVKTFGKKNAWVMIPDKKFENLKVGLLPLKKRLKETDYSGLFEEEYEKTFLDTMNLAYVAMTRPEERLFVMQKFPSGSGETMSFNKLAEQYFLKKGFTGNTEMISFGKRGPVKRKRKETARENYSLAYELSGWRERIMISRTAPESWETSGVEEKVEWGNLLHGIMSGLRKKPDLQQLKQDDINGTGEEKVRIARRFILELFEHGELDFLFEEGWEVLTEQDIMDRKGRVYRPDRVLKKDNIIKLIDFKTGDFDNHHIAQLEKYSGVFCQMGCKVSDSFLVYLASPLKIVRL